MADDWKRVQKGGLKSKAKGKPYQAAAKTASGKTYKNSQGESTTSIKPRVSKETLAKVAAIQKSSSKYLKKQSSSTANNGSTFSDKEEEDDDDDEKTEDSFVTKSLLDKTLQNYHQALKSSNITDVIIPEYFTGANAITSNICLICLSTMKRTHPIWNCTQCYCSFHIQCIQNWVRDGVQKHSLLSTELFPMQEFTWACPKCRKDYPQSESPNTYRCFCGKVVDPPDDLWLLPHSCGEMCGLELKPSCGHYCVSLCHPGPCPPCPKTVSVKCYCGRGAPVTKRCGAKGWPCGRVCRKVLSCGQHICENQCHEGECPECSYTLQQSCRCGKVTEERLCRNLDWQCGQICGNSLTCGHHNCQRICHSGECGDCPRSGERKCPCTKTSHTSLPCTQDVPTCGNTCGKLLSCNLHKCMRLCHHGDCGQCMQRIVKKCRCGKKLKETTCGTEFLCEAKCTKMKQCQRHPCRRKCCDGKCPPCELTCNRSLLCGHHKCTSLCHSGNCYPCVATVTLTCSCTKTKRRILCVQRQRIKAPKCHELCSHPPKCHHPRREPHRCHFGHCPPCQLECGLPFDCGHTCNNSCHSEPHQKFKEAVPYDATLPWDQMKQILQKHEEDMKQLIIDPCPPCVHPVVQSCDGGHQTKTFPCSERHAYSCGRSCGRVLACGNHSCTRICHVVVNPPNETEAGEDCTSCDLDCQRPRPPGCMHSCKLPCHPEECPLCIYSIKLRCHCGTMPIVLKCHEWTSADSKVKLRLQACNNRCTKLLSCGHRCSFQCHGGPCLPVDQCTQKVTLRCLCKRLKKEIKCNEKGIKVNCDEECLKVQKRKEMEEIMKAEAEREALKEKRKQEQQVMFSKQQRKKQKDTTEVQKKKPKHTKHKTLIKILVAAALMFIAIVIILIIVFE